GGPRPLLARMAARLANGLRTSCAASSPRRGGDRGVRSVAPDRVVAPQHLAFCAQVPSGFGSRARRGRRAAAASATPSRDRLRLPACRGGTARDPPREAAPGAASRTFRVDDRRSDGMNRRIVVVSNDHVGSRMAGPGIRSYHFARELRSEGDVTLVVPFETDLEPDGFELIVA